MFEYYSATSIKEAVEVLSEHGKDVNILAGGTDLLINIKTGKLKPKKVMNICDIEELKFVKCEDGFIKIGPTMTFSELEKDNTLRNHANLLCQASSEVGSTQIRNLGTIGGNIVNGAPVADSVSALMALDADIKLESKDGERIIKLTELYYGSGENRIREDELLIEISFKKPSENSATSFVKLGRRKALALSVVNVGLVVELDENDVCSSAQITVGAASRYPVRLYEIEKNLVGCKLDKVKAIEVSEDMSKNIYDLLNSSPRFSHRAPYKSSAVKGIAMEAFKEVLHGLQGNLA